MAELVIPIREYIGESRFNWDTLEMEWATNTDDLRMAVEWAQYEGLEVTAICLEIGICFGGSTFVGREMYQYLQNLGLPIRTRILSFAASMATVLMLAGDVCEIDQSAQILVHGPSGGADGTVEQVTSDLQMLSNERDALRDIYVARTGQPVEVVEQWMSKDTFFTAAEALAVGLVTKVIPIAPKVAGQFTDAQASARRARFAGIVARADKRQVRARPTPKPKAKTKAAPSATTPCPMAKTVLPITAAARKAAAKPAALTAQQKANANAVSALAKSLGVKATIEGAIEVIETEAEATATVLADGAGTLYTNGELAQGSEVFNDEALSVATDDGTYEAEDGREIVVADGVVDSVSEAQAEAPAGIEAITAAITAALAPLTSRLNALDGQVTAFSKAVPPTPRPRAVSSQAADPKTPAPKGKGLLKGASTVK